MIKQQTNKRTNESIPGWKLKLSYFYVNNKIAVKRLLLFSLFFIDLIIVFLLGTILVNYQTGIIKDEAYFRQLTSNLIDYENINFKLKPENLEVSKVEIIASDDKYDALIMIKNNNWDWAINTLTYTLTANGKELDVKTTFILPKSEKPLMFFGLENKNVEFKILEQKWTKINDHRLLSYKNSIQTTNSKYNAAKDQNSPRQIEITLYNDSPFSFWKVGLPIILQDQNSNIIGINYITIEKFLSKQEKIIQIGWPEKLSMPVKTVQTYPEINLLTESSIMDIDFPPGSPSGLE